MRVMVGCNLLTNVNTVAYPNHMAFWYALGKEKDYTVFFNTPRRKSIDRMRNETAKLALELGCDYLFFYDDDVLMPIDALTKLVQTSKTYNAAVVGAVTLVRSMPFNPMIFQYQKNLGNGIWSMTCFTDYMEATTKEGVVWCDALGFSCCLINCTILKELNPPYFVTGPDNTEDVYFCHKINEEVKQGLICVDTNVQTGHILDSYYISPFNKQVLVKTEKDMSTLFNGGVNGTKREDREIDYRDQVLEWFRRASEV